MKHTKIVTTIGPATETEEMIEALALAGMNVVRLNFSHNEHAWHKGIIERARKVAKKLGQPIGVLADMQGPRIRLETAETFSFPRGEKIIVGYKENKGAVPTDTDMKMIFLDTPNILENIKTGHTLLIEDGLVELRVTSVLDGYSITEAQTSGTIKNRKGVNLPDTSFHLPILSEKDKADLAFVLKEGVDFVALSFVGSAQDLRDAKVEMRKTLPEPALLPQIVSKIERKEAIKNLDEILKETDVVMVARGDLGIEMPSSEVSILQKEIVEKSLSALCPVIVATQMMKSMTDNPRPTRAEVSDVTNAVVDHADAVMLSEESAAGKYPVETVAMMKEIIVKTEESKFDDVNEAIHLNLRSEHATMIRSVFEMSRSFEVSAIVLLSVSGYTAKLMSHFRPGIDILVATPSMATYDQCALLWGVKPYLFDEEKPLDTFVDQLIAEAKQDGTLPSGSRVIVFLGRTPDRDTLKLVGLREIR